MSDPKPTVKIDHGHRNYDDKFTSQQMEQDTKGNNETLKILSEELLKRGVDLSDLPPPPTKETES